MAREKPGHTLQSTALVHEAWLRLGDQPFENRAHFFSAPAANSRQDTVPTPSMSMRSKSRSPRRLKNKTNFPAVHETLDALAVHDARKAELVKLHYFVSLGIKEAAGRRSAQFLRPRAKGDWTYAKAWLYREISKG